ncbi:MAG: SEC-C metal-binding domain-containing protein, partial [Candidatus Dormiibacterota bacterium]
MSRLRAKDGCWCGSGRRLADCHGAWSKRPAQAPGAVGALRSVSRKIGRPPYASGGRISGFAGPQIAT